MLLINFLESWWLISVVKFIYFWVLKKSIQFGFRLAIDIRYYWLEKSVKSSIFLIHSHSVFVFTIEFEL